MISKTRNIVVILDESLGTSEITKKQEEYIVKGIYQEISVTVTSF